MLTGSVIGKEEACQMYAAADAKAGGGIYRQRPAALTCQSKRSSNAASAAVASSLRSCASHRHVAQRVTGRHQSAAAIAQKGHA